MIDTGSAVTVLSSSIIQALGLESFGRTDIFTPSSDSQHSARSYVVDITLPNGEALHDIIAVEALLDGQNIQALIGRDVLLHGLLIYVGYMDQFTLSF